MKSASPIVRGGVLCESLSGKIALSFRSGIELVSLLVSIDTDVVSIGNDARILANKMRDFADEIDG